MFWVDRDPFVWPAGVQRSDMCDFCVVSPQEMGMPFLSPGCTAWNVAIAVRTGAGGGGCEQKLQVEDDGEMGQKVWVSLNLEQPQQPGPRQR